jgi:hypothetical protein
MTVAEQLTQQPSRPGVAALGDPALELSFTRTLARAHHSRRKEKNDDKPNP